MGKGKISRRDFVKSSIGLAVAGGFFYSKYQEDRVDSYEPQSILVDLSQLDEPGVIAELWTHARTPTLMASYAVFFPSLFDRFGFDSVTKLKEAADLALSRSSKNAHRLSALPGSAAAHLMSTTTSKQKKDFLNEVICKSIKTENREVKEILSQNLITACTENVDSLRFFSVESGVLNAIRENIFMALDEPMLLHGASFYLQFLLNARSLLSRHGRDFNEISPYNKLIEDIEKCKASHFWFLKKIIHIHEIMIDRQNNPLPPQASELLMGVNQFGYLRDYISIFALLKARLLHQHSLIISGQVKPGFTTLEESRVARPKTIAYFFDNKLEHLLLHNSFIDELPKEEALFQNFLQSEVPQLFSRTDHFDSRVKAERAMDKEQELMRLVPFSQFNSKALLSGQKKLEAQEKRLFHRFCQDGLSFIVNYFGASEIGGKIYDFVSYRFGKPEEEKKVDVGALIDALEDVNHKVDNGYYQGADQAQEECGDLIFDE